MYHIVICDDDNLYSEHMKQLLLRTNLKADLCCFHFYTSATEFANDFLKFKTIDLLILDILLPDVNGTCFAKTFRRNFPNSTLVFCSGKENPTTESFESEPYRYLLKAWTDEHMLEQLCPIVKHIQNHKTDYFIHAGWKNQHFRLSTSEIMYISRERSYSQIFLSSNCEFYSNTKKIICKKTINQLYQELQNYYFEFAHHSYLVNMKYIKFYNNAEIILLDDSVLTISRSRQKEFHQSFLNYMKG